MPKPKTPPVPTALLPEVAILVKALMEASELSAEQALNLLANPVILLWKARGGPAIVQSTPEALPLERAMLKHLGLLPHTSAPALADVLGANDPPAPMEPVVEAGGELDIAPQE